METGCTCGGWGMVWRRNRAGGARKGPEERGGGRGSWGRRKDGRPVVDVCREGMGSKGKVA
eukprot:7004831-Prorocentrum_lima.AAC.1